MPEFDHSDGSKSSLLIVKNLTKVYRLIGSFLGGKQSRVLAVDSVSFHVFPGESFGLVGESGSGKSTVARLVAGLERPSSGQVSILDTDLNTLGAKTLRKFRREVQIVFQDPYSTLDPLMTVGASIEEPMINFLPISKPDRIHQVSNLLQAVGLPARLIQAYPHQLSGGERQRVCIARALALRPRLLILDEPVSSLDRSIQGQILNLLKDLKRRYNLTYLFISHDLAVINYLCDRVAVMFHGRIIEQGRREDILFCPTQSYTQALVASVSYFLEGIDFQKSSTGR